MPSPLRLAVVVAALALSACSASPSLNGLPPRSSDALGIERAVVPPAQTSYCSAKSNTERGKDNIVANPDHNNVLKYKAPYTSPIIVVTLPGSGGGFAVCFDSKKDLFVASAGGSQNAVLEYAPPYKSLKATIMPTGLGYPDGLAVDANDDLFIADYNGNQVFVLAPPYNGTPTIISSQSKPVGMALDKSGNLFIADLDGGHTINEVAPPYTGNPTIITNSAICAPDGLSIDASGNLWVANYSCSNVIELKPPYTGKPIVTIEKGVSNPLTVAIGPHNDVFVGNDSPADTITEYAPPYKKGPVLTISGNGLGRPFDMKFAF